MVDDATPTASQGATGEPAGAAGGSAAGSILDQLGLNEQPSGDAKPGSGEPQLSDEDKAFYARLEKEDPTKWPTNLRTKVEDPFLRQFSKKQTELTTEFDRKSHELSDRENRLLNVAIEKLRGQGVEPTKTHTDMLREKIENGEMDQIAPLVEDMVQSRVAPLQAELQLRRSIEQAQSLHPFVKEREAEITQVLRSDPTLMQMAVQNGFANAPRVLQAIAINLENESLRQKVSSFEKEKLEFGRKAVLEYQAKVGGLPVSTSRGGSSIGTETKTQATSVYDAGLRAFLELGGREEDYK